MNGCEFNSLLGRYHDGELPTTRRRQLEEHLSGCTPCTGELEQMQRISQSLRHGAAEAFPRASGEFLARLQALAPSVERQTIFRFVTRLTAAAAAILVAATVHWAIYRAHLAEPAGSGGTRNVATNEGAVATPPGADEQAILDPDSALASIGGDLASGTELPADPISQELSGGRQ